MEAVVVVSMLDLSFIQNLSERDKMEIGSELAHSMFQVVFIFSLVSATRGDVLSLGSPFKERGTWKEKGEALELKCTNLQEELFVLQEEVNAIILC